MKNKKLSKTEIINGLLDRVLNKTDGLNKTQRRDLLHYLINYYSKINNVKKMRICFKLLDKTFSKTEKKNAEKKLLKAISGEK